MKIGVAYEQGAAEAFGPNPCFQRIKLLSNPPVRFVEQDLLIIAQDGEFPNYPTRHLQGRLRSVRDAAYGGAKNYHLAPALVARNLTP